MGNTIKKNRLEIEYHEPIRKLSRRKNIWKSLSIGSNFIIYVLVSLMVSVQYILEAVGVKWIGSYVETIIGIVLILWHMLIDQLGFLRHYDHIYRLILSLRLIYDEYYDIDQEEFYAKIKKKLRKAKIKYRKDLCDSDIIVQNNEINI